MQWCGELVKERFLQEVTFKLRHGTAVPKDGRVLRPGWSRYRKELSDMGGEKEQKVLTVGLPWSAVDEGLPANAGETGFHPWSREIPCAVEQLSPCIKTR